MNEVVILGQDIDEYIKCPYRLVKTKRECKKPSDYLESDFVQEVLIKEGLKFEEKILSQVEWEKTNEPLEKLLQKRCIIKHPLIRVFGSKVKKDFPEWFYNVLLVGCPDLIIPDLYNSNPVPIDIKHHRYLTTIASAQDRRAICLGLCGRHDPSNPSVLPICVPAFNVLAGNHFRQPLVSGRR